MNYTVKTHESLFGVMSCDCCVYFLCDNHQLDVMVYLPLFILKSSHLWVGVSISCMEMFFFFFKNEDFTAVRS